MPSFQLLMSLFIFLKEIIFGKEPERRKVSFATKVKNWFMLIVLFLSLGLNYLSVPKLVQFSSEIAKQKALIKELELRASDNSACEKAVVIHKEYLKLCKSK